MCAPSSKGAPSFAAGKKTIGPATQREGPTQRKDSKKNGADPDAHGHYKRGQSLCWMARTEEGDSVNDNLLMLKSDKKTSGLEMRHYQCRWRGGHPMRVRPPCVSVQRRGKAEYWQKWDHVPRGAGVRFMAESEKKMGRLTQRKG